MNMGAIELYAANGIDLFCEMLEISVCAQHCNGGVAVDMNWQSNIEGLYVVGEAAGTFGVYRPGGSALNSTQVGGLRAAEHISSKKDGTTDLPEYTLPKISYGESNVTEIREYLQSEMSRVADFDRSTKGMKALYEHVSSLCRYGNHIRRHGALHAFQTLRYGSYTARNPFGYASFGREDRKSRFRTR